MHNNISFRYDKHLRVKYTKGKREDKLLISNIILSLLLGDQNEASVMPKFGYLPEKIGQFNQIVQEAHQFSSEVAKEHGDKTVIYARFKNLFETAKQDFKYLQKAAGLALRNLPKKMDDLCLKSKRGNSIADIFIYQEFFYSLALSDEEILAALALYGYPKERLSKFYASLLECKEAYKAYTTQHSAAVEATRIRDLKIKELDSWMYEYFTMAKIASATIATI